jgi:hypothetical protein
LLADVRRMGDAQALLPIGLPLCEDLPSDLVTVESPGRTGVGLDVDEQFDGLILRDPAVESDAWPHRSACTRSG